MELAYSSPMVTSSAVDLQAPEESLITAINLVVVLNVVAVVAVAVVGGLALWLN